MVTKQDFDSLQEAQKSLDIAGHVDYTMAMASLPLPLETTTIPVPFAMEPLKIVAKHLWHAIG